MARKELPSERMELFVREYLVDLNASQAAARAGYSAKTSKQKGNQLLNREDVQAAIQYEMTKRGERIDVTADKVLKELARIGFSEVTDYLQVQTERILVDRTDDGEPISEIQQIVLLKDTDDIPPDKLAAISEIKQARDGSISFKLHDKKGALDSIAKHLGMFLDRTEITGKDGGPIQTSVDLSGLTLEELRNLAKIDS